MLGAGLCRVGVGFHRRDGLLCRRHETVDRLARLFDALLGELAHLGRNVEVPALVVSHGHLLRRSCGSLRRICVIACYRERETRYLQCTRHTPAPAPALSLSDLGGALTGV